MEKNFFSFASEMLDALTQKMVSPLVPSLAGGHYEASCFSCQGCCEGDCDGGCLGDCRGGCLGCEGSCDGYNR